MRIRSFFMRFTALAFTALLILTGIRDLSADDRAQRVSITRVSYIWYNGSPERNPQPDNTFRYGDGSTHGRTFTSKKRNPNININYSDSLYDSAVRIRIVNLNCVKGTSSQSYLTVNKSDYETELNRLRITDLTIGEYVEESVTLYYQNLPPDQQSGPVNIRVEINRVLAAFKADFGIEPADSYSDAIAKASGFSSWNNMIQTVKEQFYSREMGRLSIDGTLCWCIEPTVSSLTTGNYVSESSRLPSEQWSVSASLIITDALARGAGRNDVNGNNYYFAAQTLIWELVDGLLDYDTLGWKSGSPSGYYKGIVRGNRLEIYYQTLKEMVLAQRADSIPSFLTSSYQYQQTGLIKTYTYPHSAVDGQIVPAPEMILHDINGKVMDYLWPDSEYFHYEPVDEWTLKVKALKPFEEVQTCQFVSSRADIEAQDSYSLQIFSSSGQDQIVLGDWLYYNNTGMMRITMEGTRKTDAENGFGLYGDRTDTMVTIEGGRYDGLQQYPLHDLPVLDQPGTYIIKEVHAPVFESEYVGYRLQPQQIEVTVTENSESSWYQETWSGVFSDRRQKGKIKIIKTINGSSDISLAGATFAIHAREDIVLADGTVVVKKGELVDEVTTDESGTAVSKVLELGRYEIWETEAPFGTVLNQTAIPVDLKKADENTEIVIAQAEVRNQICGLVKVKKTGMMFTSVRRETREGYQITVPVFSERELADVRFGIYANQRFVKNDGTLIYEKDQLIQTIVTDSDGLAESGPMAYGSYYLKELDTAAGLVLDNSRHEFAVNSENGETDIIDLGSIINRQQKAAIRISKVMENGGDPTGVLFGLYAAQDILNCDRLKVILKDELIDVLKVNGGIISKTADLPYGSYYLKELKTAEGYMLDHSSHPFEFRHDGRNEKEVLIEIANGNEFENRLERITLRVIKYDSEYGISAFIVDSEGERIQLDGESLAEGVYGDVTFSSQGNCVTLPGAVFALYDEAGNLIETVTTDSNGHGLFAVRLAKGRYLLKEISAPAGYASAADREIIIDEQYMNEMLTYAIADDGESGVMFLKKNRHDQRLEDCEITIYDVSGKPVASASSDLQGRIWFTELMPGCYCWKETAAPQGYRCDEEEHEFEITEGRMIHVIVEDEGNGTCHFETDESYHTDSVNTGQHDTLTLMMLVMAYALFASCAVLVLKRLKEINRSRVFR